MSQRDLEHIIALYDGEIRFTDDILGGILAELDRCGRLDNSLVVLVSDHGQEFFEHGYKGHMRTLFDEAVLVPMIFSWPGRLPEGFTVNQQVRSIDVMPTILGLAGIPLNHEIQGRDLSRLLYGKKLSEQPALCELLADKRQHRAIRTNQTKVWIDGRTQKQWHFDLRKDPGEHSPLAQVSRKSGKLIPELSEMVRQSQALRKQKIGQTQKKVEIDEKIMQRLRSLGYIDDENKEAK